MHVYRTSTHDVALVRIQNAGLKCAARGWLKMKDAKNRHLDTIAQYGKLRPISGWDRFTSLGHSSKFQWVSRVGFVAAATSLNGDQPNFARCLAVSCAGTLCIHFRGLLLCNGILQGAKFTLPPSLAFSYIGSVTAWHSSSGRQRNFAALSRGRHLYLAGQPSR